MDNAVLLVAVWFAYAALFSYAVWRKLSQKWSVEYLGVLAVAVVSGSLCGLVLDALGRFWGVVGLLFGPIVGSYLLERELVDDEVRRELEMRVDELDAYIKKNFGDFLELKKELMGLYLKDTKLLLELGGLVGKIREEVRKDFEREVEEIVGDFREDFYRILARLDEVIESEGERLKMEVEVMSRLNALDNRLSLHDASVLSGLAGIDARLKRVEEKLGELSELQSRKGV